MAKWISPMIYDRSAADLAARTAKAFFNVSDWLRINGNARIANQLTNLYLALSVPFTELAEPAVTAFPTVADINALVNNIDLLRAAACLPAATGIVALRHDFTEGVGGTVPDYTDVNNWERDLTLIRDCLRNAMEQVVYCGVGGCGQPRFWQVRFRIWPFVQPAASPVRRPRGSLITCGTNLTRQNLFRRYA